jgi:hypothetical protein
MLEAVQNTRRLAHGAEEISPLVEYPEKNRLLAGEVTLAWKATGWRKFLEEDVEEDFGSSVRLRRYDVALFEAQEPIGTAEFEALKFDDFFDTYRYMWAADEQSQDLYSQAEAIHIVLRQLIPEAVEPYDCEPDDLIQADETWVGEGIRVVEMTRLMMRPEHAGALKWVAPINAFIEREFRKRGAVLFLRAQPSEYVMQYDVDLPPVALPTRGQRAAWRRFSNRRQAMIRLFRRTLGVELMHEKGAFDAHWMAKLLE